VTWAGTWQDAPPAGLDDFTNELPIELFINDRGNFVENGDKIRFIYGGKQIKLTVCNIPVGGKEFATFGESLQHIVKLSESTKHIARGSVRELQDYKASGNPIPPSYDYFLPKK
jgi:hypothetical protein